MELASKFVFFGTPEFAAIILKNLIKADFLPQMVVCNPDKPVGRKKIITPPPVKQSIEQQVKSIKQKIKIFQPETKENLLNAKYLLLDTDLDLFIVAAYAKIIPKEILEIPRLGAIGVHPSLLPKYRGSSPIQTAILEGEKETGVTLFLMDEKVDHGPIFAQRKLENYESGIINYELLMRKLAELSVDLLIENLPDIENKIKNAEIQNESQATYTKKFKTEDAFVQFAELKKSQKEGGETAIMIERKIRAFNPEPGVFTFIEKNGRLLRIKIFDAILKEGMLVLTKIQPEGKNIISDLRLIKQYVD